MVEIAGEKGLTASSEEVGIYRHERQLTQTSLWEIFTSAVTPLVISFLKLDQESYDDSSLVFKVDF